MSHGSLEFQKQSTPKNLENNQSEKTAFFEVFLRDLIILEDLGVIIFWKFYIIFPVAASIFEILKKILQRFPQ